MAWKLADGYFQGRRIGWLIASFILVFVLGSGVAERSMMAATSFATAIQPLGITMFGVWLMLHGLRRPILEIGSRRATNGVELAGSNADEEAISSVVLLRLRRKNALVLGHKSKDDRVNRPPLVPR
jgi:hypothetical protein